MLSSPRLRLPARQLLARRCVPSPSRPCPSRAFHASAPRNDVLLDTLLYLPHELFSIVHTQLPWYATLPVAAFVTRGLLVTTAGSWSRALTARYVGLQPLRQALALQTRDRVSRKGGFRTPKEGLVAIKKEIKTDVAKLDKRWNVTIWGQINWTLFQIPIFFTMAETIRQMSGARDGLLALSLSYIRGSADGALIDPASVAASTWFEPSMVNGGILWFENLLIPDPTGALPFVVSGLMFGNIYFTNNTVKNDKAWPNVLRRIFLGMSLLVGPLCQNMPAALMVYWASSTTSVILWNLFLNWKYPTPNDFVACKRPLELPPPEAPQPRKKM